MTDVRLPVPSASGAAVGRPGRDRRRILDATRLLPLAFLVGVAAAVSVRDPHDAGAWGVCPTYGIFGVFCPGCGSLRAMHDLVHGDVLGAIGHNALLIPAIMFAVWTAVGTPGPRWSRAWPVAVVAFTLARNLPGSPLAP